MSGLLDNCQWPRCCESCELGERRNMVASIIAGILVSLFINCQKIYLPYLNIANSSVFVSIYILFDLF